MATRKTVAEIDEAIDKLKKQKREVLKRENQQARKQRNHALTLFGAEVCAALGKPYNQVNPALLAKYLRKYSRAMGSTVLMPEPLDPADYERILKEYQKAVRSRDIAEREAVKKLQKKALKETDIKPDEEGLD